MTTLWTALLVAFLLLVLAAHESAHALALRGLGYRIVEAGLGLPISPRLIRPASRRIPFRLSLSPWLIAAYVTPDPGHQREIDALPYRDAAWYSGAGVVANFLIGGALWCALDVIDGRWAAAAMVVAGTVGLWFSRRLVTAYLFPVIGIPVLIDFGYLLATSVGQPQGPVGLGVAMVTSTWHDALVLGFVLTLALGIINLLPLYPFDGGRIADAALRHLLGGRPAAWFRGATGVLTACFVVYVMASDVVWLAR